MNESLDHFTKKLQEQIHEDTKEDYGEIAYQRWLNPLYKGTILNPDGFACIKGKCGDTMKAYLKFEKGRVKEASYQTDGCGLSNICGSFAVEMALGKSPDELPEITGEEVLEKLKGLPEKDEHCAFLAAETLQEALNNYMVKRARRKKVKGPS